MAAAVLGGWKRLRGMGRAEAMAAYLALAAQCPGFGAARYEVLELSTVRGRREKGTLVAQAPHLCPRARGPHCGSLHSLHPAQLSISDPWSHWPWGPHILGALAPPPHIPCGS